MQFAIKERSEMQFTVWYYLAAVMVLSDTTMGVI